MTLRPEYRIIPAYAGSTRVAAPRWILQWDHPRIRGEHFSPRTARRRRGGSSPHTRGALKWREVVADRCGIIPAYAGSTDPPHASSASGADHPRIRGEHDSMTFSAIRAFGSSPHTRGARVSQAHVQPRRGIIPAYAGSTGWCGSSRVGTTDHPRIRGEHKSLRQAYGALGGSSPHTRGAHRVREHHSREARIIPAYAGSTAAAGVPSATVWDHPRIRGEHGSGGGAVGDGMGSSPHTRGAQNHAESETNLSWIIPAYAGSTPTRSQKQNLDADHPRIRGEHTSLLTEVVLAAGSSPHTRGARRSCSSVTRGSGIIPAYAGSTLSSP